MTWVAVGVAAVGAIKGISDANSNRRQARRNDEFRRTAITYSPWTGMGDPGAPNVGNTDTFSGMLGGATQGFALGSGMSGAFGGGGGAASKMSTSASSPLGGQAMAQDFSKMSTGQGMTAAQNALGNSSQGMWSQMANQNGMGSAGALGSSTNNMFKQPAMGSWTQMGQQPNYLAMGY